LSRKCGKNHSEETKKKISLTLMGHKNTPCGEKAQNWKGGESLKLYPLGWTRTFREQIRARDNYKCRSCGCHEEENGRRLSVHHIDCNKENLNPENMVSLCMSCHMKVHYNKKFKYKF